MDQNAVELPLNERLLAWFEVNKTRVAYGLGAIVVVGLGIGVYVHQQNQKRVAAGEALTRAMLANPATGGLPSVSAESLLKVAAEHAGSQSAARAVLQAGTSLFTEGKFTEAQSQFERFLREYPGHPFAYEAQFGIAASLEAQGKLEEAARSYSDVAARYGSSPVALQARLSAGRLLEGQGKYLQAADIYEPLSRDPQAGTVAGEAAFRLQQLRPKLPVATNTAAITTAPGLTLTNAPAN